MKTIWTVPAAIGALIFATAHLHAVPAEQVSGLPIKVVKSIPPVFPVKLLHQGTLHGEVDAVISVDEKGQLQDCLLPRYTHQEFATAVRDAVKSWQFAPVPGADPAGVVFNIRFRFETNGVVAIQRHAIDPEPERPDPTRYHYAYAPCSPRDLDAPLQPTHIVPPSFPEEFAKAGVKGSAVIEFFVDEQGRTRIPVATRAEHDVLGALASAAVREWRFAPPTKQGKPVLVRVSQRFAFAQ